MAEPPLLVPSAVSSDFPDLPDWATRSRARLSAGASPELTIIGGEKRKEREMGTDTEMDLRSGSVRVRNIHIRTIV